MTQAEREKYAKTLLQLQARLRGDASSLTEEAFGDHDHGLSGNPIDAADLGISLNAKEQALSLLKNEELVLEEIADALDRIREGGFGLCEECRTRIPKGRLQALPYVRYCVDCARKEQQSL